MDIEELPQTKERINYRELRDFLNTLSDEQLDQEVSILGDEDNSFSGGKVSIFAFDEDQWYSEEGFFPKSAISEEEFEEYRDYYGEEFCVVIKKGDVFLHLTE